MPAVGAIAGIGSALIGASSAKKAANAQSRSADQQLALQREIYDDTTQRFQPYVQGGNSGLSAYLYEMGLGNRPTIGGTPLSIEEIRTPGASRTVNGGGGRGGLNFGGDDYTRTVTDPDSISYRVGDRTFTSRDEAETWANANPTGGTAYQGFQATPGYQFQFDQGTAAVNALAGARGGLNSGRTMQDLTKFGQGLANQEYGNYMTRLAGLTDMGQAAAGNQASAGNAYASGAGSAMAQKGNAQAAGYAGVANALQGGIQNGIGLWNYQNNLNAGLKPAGWT